MKDLLVPFTLAFGTLLVLGAFWTIGQLPPTPASNASAVVCALDVKICPDGSYLGRVGASCQFASCPTPTEEEFGTVVGRVTMGPTCPVERVPRDPRCRPIGFHTKVAARHLGGTLEREAETDGEGRFSLLLPEGTYEFRPAEGNSYPICGTALGFVVSGGTTDVHIECDSGIR